MLEENIEETQSNALPIGSKLREYEILSVLGQGGFGITYKARDTHLDKMMVIKEYMPNAFASRSYNSTVTCIPKHKETFEWGLERFLDEAKTLSKFDHISIVKALNFFEANGTAYFVMDFYEGETLEDYLLRHPKKKFSQDEILSVMMPIIEGLKAVHNEGFLHRDIAPDNIFLRQTKPPILIDFGASRNALGVQSQSIEAIVKHGYSPPEQYISRTSKQNETTDLYAISAVIYQMITGTKPPESTERQSEVFNGDSDPLEDLEQKYKNRFEKFFLQTIQKGLALKQKDRIESIYEFQRNLVVEDKIELIKGERVNLTKDITSITNIGVGLGWDTNSSDKGVNFDLDASVFMLDITGKVPQDEYFVFYNNLKSPDGSVIHQGDNRTGDGEGDDESLIIDLNKINISITELIFVVTIDGAEQKNQNFGQINNAFIRIYNLDTNIEIAKYNLDEDFLAETAIEFGRLYKKEDSWKFKAVGVGYDTGLQGFVDKFV